MTGFIRMLLYWESEHLLTIQARLSRSDSMVSKHRINLDLRLRLSLTVQTVADNFIQLLLNLNNLILMRIMFLLLLIKKIKFFISSNRTVNLMRDLANYLIKRFNNYKRTRVNYLVRQIFLQTKLQLTTDK